MTQEANRLTTAAFDAALAAKNIAPAPADRDAAFKIAIFLDSCAHRLRDAEEAITTTGSNGDD